MESRTIDQFVAAVAIRESQSSELAVALTELREIVAAEEKNYKLKANPVLDKELESLESRISAAEAKLAQDEKEYQQKMSVVESAITFVKEAISLAEQGGELKEFNKDSSAWFFINKELTLELLRKEQEKPDSASLLCCLRSGKDGKSKVDPVRADFLSREKEYLAALQRVKTNLKAPVAQIESLQLEFNRTADEMKKHIRKELDCVSAKTMSQLIKVYHLYTRLPSVAELPVNPLSELMARLKCRDNSYAPASYFLVYTTPQRSKMFAPKVEAKKGSDESVKVLHKDLTR